jgi:hypothetical protein
MKFITVGQHRGKLTVVELADRIGKVVIWKCQCDCGRIVYVDNKKLFTTARRSSCACNFCK